MQKTIIIDIDETGEVRLETRGYSGPECVEDSQFIKDVLGTETSQQLCARYYEKQGQTVKKFEPLCG
jgi:hypothetical protein